MRNTFSGAVRYRLMTVWRALAVVAAFALIACDGGSPVGPDVPSSWRTFTIEGEVRESVGLPVARGARVSGQISFDPDAPGFFKPGDPSLPRTESPDSMSYSAVSVVLTVGADSISGNDRAASTIQLLFGPPIVDLFRVDVPNGFASGRIGGRTMDRFTMTLSILPSRWPDSSLPLNADVFQSGFNFPNPGPFCLGQCTPPVGDRILGNITAVR